MTPAAGTHPLRARGTQGLRPVTLFVLSLGLSPPCPLLLLHCRLQLATVGAGVDVVKVVERQPALLLVDEASPLSDWSQMDQDELQQQIQVSGSR